VETFQLGLLVALSNVELAQQPDAAVQKNVNAALEADPVTDVYKA
jgi:hypothetical protein